MNRELDFTYTLYIAASPARVWAALTDGAITPKYYFGRRFESTLEPGAEWRSWMPDPAGAGEIVDSQGIIEECVPDKKLGMTWRVVWVPEFKDFPEGYVTYTLEEAGPGVTRLRMEQSHAEPVPEYWLEMGRKGWAAILSGLKTLLETGKPLPPLQM